MSKQKLYGLYPSKLDPGNETQQTQPLASLITQRFSAGCKSDRRYMEIFNNQVAIVLQNAQQLNLL